MKTLACVAVVLIGLFSIHVGSPVQAQSFGTLGFGPIAPTLSGCQTGMAGYTMLCTVGSGTTYAIYVSFNGASYVPLVTAPPAGGVLSLNGKTGALVLTNSAVTTVTSTVQ